MGKPINAQLIEDLVKGMIRSKKTIIIIGFILLLIWSFYSKLQILGALLLLLIVLSIYEDLILLLARVIKSIRLGNIEVQLRDLLPSAKNIS